MLNRRGFFSYLAGALGFAAVPIVAKSDYVPALLTPGESVISHRYYYKLWNSRKALAELNIAIKKWSLVTNYKV